MGPLRIIWEWLLLRARGKAKLASEVEPHLVDSAKFFSDARAYGWGVQEFMRLYGPIEMEFQRAWVNDKRLMREIASLNVKSKSAFAAVGHPAKAQEASDLLVECQNHADNAIRRVKQLKQEGG